MGKFARVEKGVVVEILDVPEKHKVEDCFHADLVKTMVDIAGRQVKVGMQWDGKSFKPPSEFKDPTDVTAEAAAKLTASDSHLMQLFEDGKEVPQAWKDYRKKLRAIIDNPDKIKAVPDAPK